MALLANYCKSLCLSAFLTILLQFSAAKYYTITQSYMYWLISFRVSDGCAMFDYAFACFSRELL